MAATSDIHSPRYLPLLREATVSYQGSPCALILAGDLVDRGIVSSLKPVLDILRGKFPETPIIAVFGNEEYHDREDEFRRGYPEITWLDDDYTILECGEENLAIIGTRGALQRPTRWQRRHMPWLERVYRERPAIIARLIDEARREASRVVLVSHYALSRKTIEGEPPRIWPELYSPLMEKVVVEKKPDAAIHGHAHNGKPYAIVAGVPVYNVALPLNKRLVTVKAGRRSILDYA